MCAISSGVKQGGVLFQYCSDGFQKYKLRDGGPNFESAVDMLVDTVARMQKNLAMIRVENLVLITPATSQVTQAPRRAALTTTKVPRFDGSTSWEQYNQVFETIVRLHGWDNDTAALQLFLHLEGDALNVAHLVPLARRLSRLGLVDVLTAHYGLPGRSERVPVTCFIVLTSYRHLELTFAGCH